MLVHDVCDLAAIKFPDQGAISDPDQRWTFRQLSESVEALAAWLADKGLRKGDIVACLSRSTIECYALFLACSKVGTIFAPLNYRSAIPELKAVLTGCKSPILLFSDEYAESAALLKSDPDLGFIKVFRCIQGATGRANVVEEARSVGVRSYFPELDESDISWVCFTSGTTGRAKGVLLSHRNMLAAAVNFISFGKISEADVYLRTGGIFHIGLFTPLAYWLIGARVVIANFEARATLDLISREGVTQFIAPGATLRMLIEENERQPRKLRIRTVFGGAAPLSPVLARRATEVLGCEIGQIYGQTENSLASTFLASEDYRRGFEADDDASMPAKRLTSVGRAVPMCAVRVVNEEMQPLKPGEVGEVAFKGPTVMEGYLGMPELTAQTVKSGWLLSGDIGYMDEDGYVYLLDRKKDMIISGGENVFSVQVETVLYSHPQIQEAVVIGIPDEQWGELVAAIVVTKPDCMVDESELKAFCRRHLAGYKIPKRIEFRASLPRIDARKIDKAAIKKEFWQGKDRLIN